MPFQSDHAAKRTFDPESGWELFDVAKGPDYPSYELRRDGSETLHFWCKKLALEEAEGVNHLGHPRFKKTIKVHLMNELAASDENKRLIYEALDAYGALHNGPSGQLTLTWDEAFEA